MEQISFQLPVFEGPMDLLLHLIQKHKLNINDIPIFTLVEQYTAYIRRMQDDDMDLASEFLEMAARLVYIKTVSLLPVHEEARQLKQELEGELIEYQECKLVAEKLSHMTGGFNLFVRAPEPVEATKEYTRIHMPDVLADAYLAAVGKGRRKLPPPPDVFEPLVATRVVPVHVKISYVLRKLMRRSKMRLKSLYESATDRSELVATFLAVLQLARDKRVYIDGEGEDAQITSLKEEGNGL